MAAGFEHKHKHAQRHVLVTRTGPEGEALAHRVEARGDRALCLPLVELVAVEDPEAVRATFHGLPTLSGVIITSREGVRQSHSLGLLDEMSQIHGPLPVVVPGPGTAKLARQYGLDHVVYPVSGRGASEQMLELDQLRFVEGRCWLIVAAADGRRLLDRELKARGARVERLIVYQRRLLAPSPAALDSLSRQAQWTTLLASGAALDRLHAALPPTLWRRISRGPMVVPSRRLLDRAETLGVARLVLSDGAGDEAMLDALG